MNFNKKLTYNTNNSITFANIITIYTYSIMKHIQLFLSTILSTIAIVCSAQDTIIFRNGDEVSAIVSEILVDEVKYKKASNADGPTYTMPKNEIFMIKFKNGEKEVFSETQKPQSNDMEHHVLPGEIYHQEAPKVEKASNMTPAFYSPMARYQVTRRSESGLATNNGTYYLSEYEAMQLLGRDYDRFSTYARKSDKGFKLMIGGAGLYAVSIPMMIMGANGTFNHWEDLDYNYHDHDETVSNIVLTTGIFSMVASSVLIRVGIVKFVANRVRAKRIAKTLNGIPFEPGKYDSNVSLSLGAKPNGMAFTLTF